MEFQILRLPHGQWVKFSAFEGMGTGISSVVRGFWALSYRAGKVLTI